MFGDGIAVSQGKSAARKGHSENSLTSRLFLNEHHLRQNEWDQLNSVWLNPSTSPSRAIGKNYVRRSPAIRCGSNLRRRPKRGAARRQGAGIWGIRLESGWNNAAICGKGVTFHGHAPAIRDHGAAFGSRSARMCGSGMTSPAQRRDKRRQPRCLPEQRRDDPCQQRDLPGQPRHKLRQQHGQHGQWCDDPCQQRGLKFHRSGHPNQPRGGSGQWSNPVKRSCFRANHRILAKNPHSGPVSPANQTQRRRERGEAQRYS